MKTVNAYLVKGEYNTLIDCGENSENNWLALNKGLGDHGVELKDIDKVLITHAHVDHMGMARRIADKYDVKIHVSDLVYDWAISLDKEWTHRNEIMKLTFGQLLTQDQKDSFMSILQSFFGKVSDLWEVLDEDQVKVFNYDEDINISGTDFQSIHCPGHTYTQTCFFNPLNGDFISADMLLKITPTCVIEANVERRNERNRAMPQLLASFEKLKGLDIGTIYPGHYEIMENHIALIDKQVARINMRKDQVLSLIKNGTNRYLDLYNELYNGQINFPALVMTRGYLDLLEDEKSIDINADGLILCTH